MTTTYEVYGTNNLGKIHIVSKITLGGALCFASELSTSWDQILIYEIRENGQSELLAIISFHGLQE